MNSRSCGLCVSVAAVIGPCDFVTDMRVWTRPAKSTDHLKGRFHRAQLG